jgi:hypothetical protein
VRADDADAQMAQRELPPLLQIVRIVEPHAVAPVDERHASAADHLADVAANDQRRILVDAEPHQLGIAGDDDEQPLQAGDAS